MVSLTTLVILFTVSHSAGAIDTDDGSTNQGGSARYRIEGRVLVTQAVDQEWISNTRVMVDGGHYLGILK